MRDQYKLFLILFFFLPLLATEAQPVRSRRGPEPAEVLWDAGNCEDPPGWISRPQNLQGFLQQVGKKRREKFSREICQNYASPPAHVNV